MKAFMARVIGVAALALLGMAAQASAQTVSTVEALGFVGGVTDGEGTTGRGVEVGTSAARPTGLAATLRRGVSAR